MRRNIEKSSVASNIEQVVSWKEKQLGLFEQQAQKLQQKRRELEQEIHKLQQQLVGLDPQETLLKEQESSFGILEQEKMQEALLSGLKKSQKLIEERIGVLKEQRSKRSKQVQSLLDDPKFKEKIVEFEEFQNLQETLKSLPASYRSAVLQHHSQVRQDLQPIFQAASQPLDKSTQPMKSIGLVAAIEPNFETPEAMALLIPVPFEVYVSPKGGEDGLLEIVAFRCCGAITAALKKIGLKEASIQFETFQGFLSMQIWLGGVKLAGNIQQAFDMELDKVQKTANEFQATQLSFDVTWVNPVVLGGE